MTTIVIPARWASSRYPGKPLAKIRGADGVARSLIERSWQGARSVPGDHEVVVATDNDRIVEAVEEIGGRAVMTPESCRNGTERVAALAGDGSPDEVFVNFQGDALLTPPDFVAALIAHMEKHPDCEVATVAVRCTPGTYRHIVTDQAEGRVGGTTAIVNAAGNAQYFSKRVLPHISPGDALENDPPVLLHLGLYAYRRSALLRYAALPPCRVEEIEGLEQLRFLHHEIPMAVLALEPPDWDMIELNNPQDLEPIERILAERGIA